MTEHITFKGIEYEECSEEEAYNKETNYLKKGYLGIYSDSDVKEIFFKPVQKFPIVFEGDNFRFIIYETLRFDCAIKDLELNSFTDKDIEANQNALNKLKELRK